MNKRKIRLIRKDDWLEKSKHAEKNILDFVHRKTKITFRHYTCTTTHRGMVISDEMVYGSGGVIYTVIEQSDSMMFVISEWAYNHLSELELSYIFMYNFTLASNIGVNYTKVTPDISPDTMEVPSVLAGDGLAIEALKKYTSYYTNSNVILIIKKLKKLYRKMYKIHSFVPKDIIKVIKTLDMRIKLLEVLESEG